MMSFSVCFPRCLSAFVFVLVTGSSLFALPLVADQTVVSDLQTQHHQQAIEAWRVSRHESLTRPDGWLTLVGLEWLKEGVNRVGSAADNDIQLAGGPAYWGRVSLQNNQLRFTNLDNESVRINNEVLAQVELVPDTEGKPTLVTSGALSFYAIFRESYALRIKDSQAKTLLNFKGVDNYAINTAWRIEGRLVLAAEGEGIEIANVLGQISESPVFGTFEFDMNGKTLSLLGLGSEGSEDIWFIFADRTNGHGSYGAGRFLYSEGMPKNGRLTVDFNKAYNPPCAFNAYSTCPLPPKQNRLDLFVTAGEKEFHPNSG